MMIEKERYIERDREMGRERKRSDWKKIDRLNSIHIVNEI